MWTLKVSGGGEEGKFVKCRGEFHMLVLSFY
jgi:hypothetical protein